MIKLGLLGNNISKSEMPNLITKLGNEFGLMLSTNFLIKLQKQILISKNF